jgi:hypothetical protein
LESFPIKAVCGVQIRFQTQVLTQSHKKREKMSLKIKIFEHPTLQNMQFIKSFSFLGTLKTFLDQNPLQTYGIRIVRLRNNDNFPKKYSHMFATVPVFSVVDPDSMGSPDPGFEIQIRNPDPRVQKITHKNKKRK